MITEPLCKAARALVEIERKQLAETAKAPIRAETTLPISIHSAHLSGMVEGVRDD